MHGKFIFITVKFDRTPRNINVSSIRLKHTLKCIKYCDNALDHTQTQGQWLFSKIIPVHKKGDKQLADNYPSMVEFIYDFFKDLFLKNDKGYHDVIQELFYF